MWRVKMSSQEATEVEARRKRAKMTGTPLSPDLNLIPMPVVDSHDASTYEAQFNSWRQGRGDPSRCDVNQTRQLWIDFARHRLSKLARGGDHTRLPTKEELERKRAYIERSMRQGRDRSRSPTRTIGGSPTYSRAPRNPSPSRDWEMHSVQSRRDRSPSVARSVRSTHSRVSHYAPYSRNTSPLSHRDRYQRPATEDEMREARLRSYGFYPPAHSPTKTCDTISAR